MQVGQGVEPRGAAGPSGWAFLVNAALLVLVVILLVTALSVVNLRAAAPAQADPLGDPSTPLTIEGVSVVPSGAQDPDVHVAATQTSLVAVFQASATWRVSPRQCLADVVGSIDVTGKPQWQGERAGHMEVVAGDSSSNGMFAAGPGEYCQLGGYSSLDGGLTWSPESLPAGASASPSWLAFDPARAGSLLAFRDGVLYARSAPGAAWTSRRSSVTPIGFDSAGRLVGWSSGNLLESLDDGSTWRRTGPGPSDEPAIGAATPNGALLASKAGLWWYPLSAPAELIRSDSVYSMAALGDSVVVLGADGDGHPWLGTVADSEPGIALATLPAELASLPITGGQVAVNDSGAVIALSGPSSAFAFASFVR